MKSSYIGALCLVLTMSCALAHPQPDDHLMMGNPASAYCASNYDGSLFLAIDSKTGGQYGICQINDKQAFEEWCLFRKDMNVDKRECPNLISIIQDNALAKDIH